MSSRLLEPLPGMALCAALTGAIIWARPLLPEYFGDALLAVLVGVLVGNLVGTPAATKPGLDWMSRTGLRLAIVLMGRDWPSVISCRAGWLRSPSCSAR